MSNIVIIGAQWGDEGKGKIVDLLSSNINYIVRFQGGNNAGHTVIVDGTTYILHLIPSGVVHEEKVCIIGNGVVLDMHVLCKEIDILKTQGIMLTPERLKISKKAHIIMPYHKILDCSREGNSDELQKIGTTGRGIGPCYEDKVSRFGIRAVDLMYPEVLRERIIQVLKEKNVLFSNLYNLEPLSVDDVFNEIMEIAPRIIPYLVDVSEILQQALEHGSIMFEGAQGVQLDVDHGSYPFVTSSNTIAGNASIGSGIALPRIERVIGVFKSYTTRVGSGPFPTELHGEFGDMLREKGKEFGTTTGRLRRCGWQDMVILRESIRLNGFNELALTKLDVLSGCEEIKMCVAYEYKGRTYTYPPQDGYMQANAITPIYETFQGWETSLVDCTSWSDLPMAVKAYVERIEDLAGVPITIISVGPERSQTIVR